MQIYQEADGNISVVSQLGDSNSIGFIFPNIPPKLYVHYQGSYFSYYYKNKILIM